MKRHITAAIFIIVSLILVSCQKYLDKKPDAKLATPASLHDLQAMLDYYRGMNAQYPAGTGILSDNYYITSSNWAAISRSDQRNYYIWQKDDNNNSDWNNSYNSIYTCNTVLESLSMLPVNEQDKEFANHIKGSALFFRGFFHYGVAQLFAKGYNKSTSSTDMGIPLRLSTDFTKKSTRASVEDTYNHILSDLKDAVALLPLEVSIKSRPSKAAAYGALARTYLAMSDYPNAYDYADSCLTIISRLIDYNTLDTNAAAPFRQFNEEVVFQAVSFAAQPLKPTICKIDTSLYLSYAENDLRKVLFFTKNTDLSYKFKGDYDGTSNNGNGHSFIGIVTDEQFLIRAECAVRLGKSDQAKSDIDHLLAHRFRQGTYIPQTISNHDSLLSKILHERRKELLFRGSRWTDLKRLNQDVRFATAVIRKINGTTYELEAGPVKYIPLIPKKVIDMSGIEQNP